MLALGGHSCFRPQKEIKAKLGGGRTIHSGPSFARLQYIIKMHECRFSRFLFTIHVGKTKILRSLNKTYMNMKRKPIWQDLNPKAVTNDELFGYINPATREWKDGRTYSMSS